MTSFGSVSGEWLPPNPMVFCKSAFMRGDSREPVRCGANDKFCWFATMPPIYAALAAAQRSFFFSCSVLVELAEPGDVGCEDGVTTVAERDGAGELGGG